MLTFLHNLYATKQAIYYGFHIPQSFVGYLERRLGYTLGDYSIHRKPSWPDGRPVEPVAPTLIRPGAYRPFKGGIDALVLENWKRSQQKILLIPLLFLIDYESVPTRQKQYISNKDINENGYITSAEVRRCYKLAHHPNEEIAQIARQTFVFLKLKVLATSLNDPKTITQCEIEKISAPWERPDWAATWTRPCRHPGSKSRIEEHLWLYKLRQGTPKASVIAEADEVKSSNLRYHSSH